MQRLFHLILLVAIIMIFSFSCRTKKGGVKEEPAIETQKVQEIQKPIETAKIEVKEVLSLNWGTGANQINLGIAYLTNNKGNIETNRYAPLFFFIDKNENFYIGETFDNKLKKLISKVD